MEFDRCQRQLARHSEALLEDVQLSPEELEQIFPPAGPIQHARESFKHLPAVPAWHEPLIFLLETRKADAPTLLRWLFPALHSANQESRTKNKEPQTPLLPLDAVRLLVKLTADPEIPVPAEKRQDWWQRLWSAYLDWQHERCSPSGGMNVWPIAPLLLGAAVDRSESLRLLGAAFSKKGGLPSASPVPPLYLWECHHLTSADLTHLAALNGLTHLELSYCSGLRSLEGLPPLPQLEKFDLGGCRGLEGNGGLAALAACPALKSLDLTGCTGLRSLEGLPPLPQLERLDVEVCRGLEGNGGLATLARCPALKSLVLSQSYRISDNSIVAFLEAWRAQRGADAPRPRIVWR
jgi:hypothetical protein